MTEDQFTSNNEPSRRSFDNNWAMGLALIIVGTLFMLDTFDIMNINLHNWWAIFILVPGISMAVRGWKEYREVGTKSSRSTGFWGVVLIIVAGSFFFNISWNLVFPIILMGLGIYLLFYR